MIVPMTETNGAHWRDRRHRKRGAPVLGNVFVPATRLMARFRYAKKFALIAVVMLLPLAYVGHAYLADQGSKIGFSAKERVGVTYVAPANKLLTQLAAGRTLAVEAAIGNTTAQQQLPAQVQAIQAAVAGLDRVDKRVGGSLQTTAMWSRLRGKIATVIVAQPTDPTRTLTAWSGLTADTVGLITQAGNTSNLILDPDLDSFYVMDALIVKTPALIDSAGLAGDRELLMGASSSASLDSRIQLAVDKGVISNLTTGLSADLKTAFGSTGDAALEPSLSPKLKPVTDSATALQAQLTQGVHGSADPALAARTGDAAARASTTLGAAMTPSLDHLLATRIAGFQSARQRVAIVAVISLLIAAYLFVGFYLAVIASVSRMKSVADGIADGDMEHDVLIASNDEIGVATRDFATTVMSYLREVAGAARGVADGDLSIEIAPRSERDALGLALSGMLDSLREVVGEVAHSSAQMTAASQEMATMTADTVRAVSEIARASEGVAQGAENQVRMVEQAGNSAAETGESVRDASQAAEAGAQTADRAGDAIGAMQATSEQVAEAIRDLATKSTEIGGIVATITGIAEQTNLLALNAAIEAARAGDQGRGFAVVAEEVRKLAEEAQGAAGKIAIIITEIQSDTQRVVDVVAESGTRTEAGVAAVASTREAFVVIGGTIVQVTEQIDRIAGLTTQVAEVAESASAAAEQVSASTQQTNASAQEISATAQRVAGAAQALDQVVSRFRLQRVE
jgi:methyl-accepting chemotaxis protein